MEESALNVKIPSDLKIKVKVESAKQHNTIRTFVIVALREKLERIENGIDAEDS